MNKHVGKYELIHRIFNNKSEYIIVNTISAYCNNLTTNNNIKLKINTLAAFVQGKNYLLDSIYRLFSISYKTLLRRNNNKLFLLLHHNDLHKNIASNILVRVKELLISNGDNVFVQINVITNPTLTFNKENQPGSAIWYYLSNTFDNIEVSDGYKIYSYIIGNDQIISKSASFNINPGDFVAITYTIDNINNVSVNLDWTECN